MSSPFPWPAPAPIGAIRSCCAGTGRGIGLLCLALAIPGLDALGAPGRAEGFAGVRGEFDFLFRDRFQTIPEASLELEKSIVAGDPFAAVGDVMEYELTATNSGDADLADVEIRDPELSQLDCTPPQPVDVASGEVLVCTGSYTVDQADIDDGGKTNLADATALGFLGEPVFASDGATADGPEHLPALSLTREWIESIDPIEVGSELAFRSTAVNEGNVTLIEMSVTDTLVGVGRSRDCQWDGLVEGELRPDQQVICDFTYTVTQDDVDAGEVTGTAFVSARDQELTMHSDLALQTVTIDQHPGLGVVKTRIDSTDPVVEGSLLTYEIVATNTGDVTLTKVVVADSLVSVDQSVDCDWVGTQAELAVDDSVVCTIDYTVTADDAAAYEVVNIGTATGEDPDSGEIRSGDNVTVSVGNPDPSPVSIQDGLVEPLGNSLERVFYFDEVDKQWYFFDVRPEFADSNTLTELIPGASYWLLVNEPVSVELNGHERDLTCTDPGTVDEDCWNLIVW